MRRALGKLRRSPVLAYAATLLGVQSRRVRQRWHARFVRGVHLRTHHYISRQATPTCDTFFPLPHFEEQISVAAPTFAPNGRGGGVGGPLLVRSEVRGISLLHDPFVVGGGGAVIARDRHLLWDLSYEWPGNPHDHSVYQMERVAAVRLPGATATLAAMGADHNYFHFLLNSVARLVYLNGLPGIFPDRYLISGSVTDFIAETLSLFGIPRARLIGTKEAAAFRPEVLVAPPLIHHPFIVPAHACEFVRTCVLGKLPPRSGARRRIMVDRSDAPSRRIENFLELRGVLAEFDIELVQLTGLSVAEQAQLFRDAELVIANHGAALTNLIFCDPGTRVLQVLAPGMMEREYRTISQHCRLRHDYLVGDFANPADARLPVKQRDLVLPPSLLRSVLRRGMDSNG